MAVACLKRVFAVAHVSEAYPPIQDVDEQNIELGVLVLADRWLGTGGCANDMRVVGAACRLVNAQLAIEKHWPGRAVVRLKGREAGVLQVGNHEALLEGGVLHGAPPAGYFDGYQAAVRLA